VRVRETRNDRLEQHDGRDVAGDVGKRGDDDRKDDGMMEVPVVRVTQQVLRQPGFLRSADDDEETYEEDQQPPVDLVVGEIRTPPSARLR
jgi:hypothetical protein